MTNRKTTKRALLGSVLALVLCFAMLLGSTYAWFTDTETAAVSTIKSGTLDLEVTVYDKVTGNYVDPTALFNETLWEPGYMAYEIMKIENKGSLALKWMAKMDLTQLSALADVITVYVNEASTVPASRNDVETNWTRVGTLADFVSTLTTADNTVANYPTDVLAPNSTDYLGIALVMETSAGNAYQNLTVDGFTFTVIATQDNVESDDFDANYDDITFETVATYETYNVPAGEHN